MGVLISRRRGQWEERDTLKAAAKPVAQGRRKLVVRLAAGSASSLPSFQEHSWQSTQEKRPELEDVLTQGWEDLPQQCIPRSQLERSRSVERNEKDEIRKN